jgi:hypothetical protein
MNPIPENKLCMRHGLYSGLETRCPLCIADKVATKLIQTVKQARES